MPLALLLSPDDQAVSAITAVLEEMSVNCERPLDGVSAAKQLNSHSFDLVLVDCENLPAAKLIFDVCRRGKGGNGPVPIAIVDGRAGLPTAFRLGAELILTKPVAKDQARSTIRTAVGRIRKEEPVNTAQSAAVVSPQQSEAVHANAAESETSQAEGLLTNYEVSHDHSTTEPRAMAASAAGAAPSVKSPYASPASHGALLESEEAVAAAKAPAVRRASKPTSTTTLSDDPVMADLERADRGEMVPEPHAPLFSAYSEKKKSRGPLVALFVLVLAGGGFYAAWMYQPGFREIVQPQIERVLSLIGMGSPAQAPAPAAVPEKPADQPAPAPAPTTPADSAQPANGDAGTTPASRTAPASASPASGTPISTVTPAPPVAQRASSVNGTPEAKLVSTNASADKPMPVRNSSISSKGTDSKTFLASSSDAELPGDKAAVILSSKGAEKRLTHSVHATYPSAARSTGVEGTVVVKTIVNERGSVAAARAVEGDPVLASAAVAAVKQWRYRPYVRDGKTLPFQTVVLVDFQKP